MKNELEKILSELCRLEISKVTFGSPYSKSAKVKKCRASAVETSKGRVFCFESFTDKQAFHENVKQGELENKICSILKTEFRQAEIFTPEYVYGLKLTDKGKILHNRRKNTDSQKPLTSHNREKKHIIDLENAPPVFRELGIIGADGKIINSKYDKFKQICRFVEIINDAVSRDTRQAFDIVDFGCGKSYLTFVVYHYFTEILGKKVRITGLDLKHDVIERCNALAEKYGCEGLRFLCMDVKDYVPEKKPDMVIALHACDTATDYALYNAYLWQADYVFSAPCCQHEMNAVMKRDCGILADYGLLKERFCALSTDALRCKLLEFCGYSVDIAEFVDSEISPKNLMIRAVRNTRVTVSDRKRIIERVFAFDGEFCPALTLERLIFSDIHTEKCGGKEFEVIAGKSSMLIKDAMLVRREVFGKEQGYSFGASRDADDETAWLVNVYADGKALATSRMVVKDKTSALLGKIAVSGALRGCGLGRIMLAELEKKALTQGINTLYVNAQQHALDFYKKLGFSECSQPYIDEGITMIPVKKCISAE